MYLLYSGFFDKARKRYFNQVIKRCSIRKGEKLLDYGCGPGDMLSICSLYSIQAYGVDNELRSIELAQAKGLNVTLGDYNSLPFEQDFFDVIFMQSVLEHLPKPIDAINHLNKYLKKGGHLILSAPTPGPFFWNDPTHIRPYTPKSFQIISDICGLKLIEVNYVFSFMLGLKITNSLFFLILNLLPFPLGTNLIGIYKKVQ